METKEHTLINIFLWGGDGGGDGSRNTIFYIYWSHLYMSVKVRLSDCIYVNEHCIYGLIRLTTDETECLLRLDLHLS